MPVRIQRKRTRGWRMPEGAISVTRPTFYGNPFVVGDWYSRGSGLMTYTRSLIGKQAGFVQITSSAEAIEWYRWYAGTWGAARIERLKRELGGCDLACWCPLSSPCHADILLELANR